MSSYDEGKYFDQNANTYGKKYSIEKMGQVKNELDRLPEEQFRKNSYAYIFNFLKDKRNGSLLDIGGGSGFFSILSKNCFPELEITIVDPSIELLNMIDQKDVRKIIGKLPDQLNLEKSCNFDFIHMGYVLHHIIGNSIGESRKKAKESLLTIKSIMNKNSYFSLDEIFYESYILPTYSKNLIFYTLRLQNLLQLKIPSREFLLDLSVNFYTRAEIYRLLDECGFNIIDVNEYYWKNTLKTRALMIRNWGITQITSKVKS